MWNEENNVCFTLFINLLLVICVGDSAYEGMSQQECEYKEYDTDRHADEEWESAVHRFME